jgi:hypothetical protein
LEDKEEDPMYDYPGELKVPPAWLSTNIHAGQLVSNMMEQVY